MRGFVEKCSGVTRSSMIRLVPFIRVTLSPRLVVALGPGFEERDQFLGGAGLVRPAYHEVANLRVVEQVAKQVGNAVAVEVADDGYFGSCGVEVDPQLAPALLSTNSILLQSVMTPRRARGLTILSLSPK